MLTQIFTDVLLGSFVVIAIFGDVLMSRPVPWPGTRSEPVANEPIATVRLGARSLHAVTLEATQSY